MLSHGDTLVLHQRGHPRAGIPLTLPRTTGRPHLPHSLCAATGRCAELYHNLLTAVEKSIEPHRPTQAVSACCSYKWTTGSLLNWTCHFIISALRWQQSCCYVMLHRVVQTRVPFMIGMVAVLLSVEPVIGVNISEAIYLFLGWQLIMFSGCFIFKCNIKL